MAHDALSPGDGSYPYFPRHADGTPAWSDTPETDGQGVVNAQGVTVAPMPRGVRYILRRGQRIATDLTPRDANGNPIVVPPLEPTP